MISICAAPPVAAQARAALPHSVQRNCASLSRRRVASPLSASLGRRGALAVRRAKDQNDDRFGEEQDSESYANGTAVEAGEGLGMDTEDMDGSAGSAALELIDVAVSAASTNSVAVLKGRLLRAVAPVDRGVAATPWDMDAIEEAAQALEAASRDEPESLDRIDERISGKWRLIYSSTFAGKRGGSQGFTGSPTTGTPLRLGAVYQRIQARKQIVDNIVEISLPAPLPFAPPLKGSATLSHSLEVTGERTIRITFDSITFRPQGFPIKNVPLRPLTIPSPFKMLQLPPEFRGGAFDTTFADEDLRVSRGDRGELRVFVRA